MAAASVTISGLSATLRGMERDLDRTGTVAASYLGREAVSVLRSKRTFYKGSGKGEFLIGKQRDSYVFMLRGDRVAIGNFARNPRNRYAYPQRNEARFQVAGRAVRRHRSRIVAAAQAAVDSGKPEYRGSYRRARLARG